MQGPVLGSWANNHHTKVGPLRLDGGSTKGSSSNGFAPTVKVPSRHERGLESALAPRFKDDGAMPDTFDGCVEDVENHFRSEPKDINVCPPMLNPNREAVQHRKVGSPSAPNTEPSADVDLDVEPSGVSSKQQEEPCANCLRRANGKRSKVIDVSGGRDAQGHGEPIHNRVIGKVPPEGGGRASHAQRPQECTDRPEAPGARHAYHAPYREAQHGPQEPGR